MKDWRTASVGNFLRWKGATWVIDAKVGSILQLTNVESEENAKLPVADWMDGCFSEAIKMVEHPGEDLPEDRKDISEVTFSALPPSMQAAVLRMRRYIEAYERPRDFYQTYLPHLPEDERKTPDRLSESKVMPLLHHVALTIAGEKRPPGFSTFCGWMKRWRRYQDWRMMAPRYDKRGSDTRTIIVGPMKRIIDGAIKRVWMTKARNTKVAVCESVEHAVLRYNGRHPDKPIGVSRRQINRYMSENIDQYEEAVARIGKRNADDRFKPVVKGPGADYVFEILEVDHTQAKIEVIDDVTGENLGRPWITASLCRRSRMVCGVHLHFDGPSLHAVMQCLRNTMMPKGFLKKLVSGIDYDYPCAGTPLKFFFDRGTDYDNEHVQEVGLNLDIRTAYAPGENPGYKASIERFFGTLHGQVAYPIKGSTRRVKNRVTDNRPRKSEATMPFSDFYERLWHWATMVYAKDFHDGLNDVPLDVWNESAAVRSPRPPPSKRKLDDVLMRTVRCEATREGVQYKGLIWNGDLIRDIVLQPGPRHRREVLLRIDDGDISNAKVINPATGLLTPVQPVLERYMRGTSMHAHELVLRRVAKKKEGTHSERSLVEAKKRMELQAAATWSKKSTGSKVRARLARLAGIGSMAPSGDDLGSLDPVKGLTSVTDKRRKPTPQTETQVEPQASLAASPVPETDPPAPAMPRVRRSAPAMKMPNT
ncbi:DDE-type integrase/transposase/recombinase [Muricoccus aerilatus]|uniref:DDE-type integrase/transposase/recombinase n=1 Tax=Muricoccus aerilatus TaxID=452982 RepID=UPI0005C157BC|nr:DDE-type integrase/transposase/recombinase [Roseomonas aerilata]